MWNLSKSKTSNSKTTRRSVLLLALATALLCTNPVTAHEEDETSIKVHGDWVITVSNPDGSIAQERSFQNALTNVGKHVLVTLLAPYNNHPTESTEQGILEHRANGDPAWNINAVVTGDNDTPECNKISGEAGDVAHADGPTNAVVSAKTITSFTLTRNLVMPIHCLSGASYAITAVSSETIIGASVDGTVRFLVGNFTEKTLDAPITGILADQVVTLKATISFQ